MNHTAIVTGAGSGVGQATALKLAQLGWRVALVGRRPEALHATVQLAGERAPQFLEYPCDIGDVAAVNKMTQQVLGELGDVDVLVNAAGTNAPRRALEVLSLEDYHAMLNANLHGAYYCAQAVLPGMRARGSGTIVNVISDAGKQASPKAGPAYVMSKFGLSGLTQAINAEERSRGIRAIGIFPGDIDTPLLNRRPQAPDAAARAKMLKAEDIADCVVFCLSLPSRVVIEEMLVRPR
ncbi:MAG TPA: SDR family oxidoreductase [Verrucomicrobiota bacterium]|nr:short-chain dehydrogenase [Verrucomicrobiales bacterium]HRI13984.1 SDR family oxidoreductase [Verrucomicrobiota bacterium]